MNILFLAEIHRRLPGLHEETGNKDSLQCACRAKEIASQKGQDQNSSLHFKQGLRVKPCLLELCNLCKQVLKQVLAQLAKAFSKQEAALLVKMCRTEQKNHSLQKHIR